MKKSVMPREKKSAEMYEVTFPNGKKKRYPVKETIDNSEWTNTIRNFRKLRVVTAFMGLDTPAELLARYL